MRLAYEAVNGSLVICRDDEGRQVMIVFFGGLGRPIIRSVIRQKVPGLVFTCKDNGEAGRNAEELKFWPNARGCPWTVPQLPEHAHVEEYQPSLFPQFAAAGGGLRQHAA